MDKKIKFDIRAIPFLVLILGVFLLFMYMRVRSDPVEYKVKTGNIRLQDGQYEEAINEFSEALQKNPEHAMAHLGLSLTYMQMENYDAALQGFNTAIKLNPELAAAYADRGILYDRMGQHEKALADYRKALEMDPEILKGPNWLWRFLRNVDEKPPTIKDRADYLEAELAKPEAERLLKIPEEDKKQRMYKIDD